MALERRLREIIEEVEQQAVGFEPVPRNPFTRVIEWVADKCSDGGMRWSVVSMANHYGIRDGSDRARSYDELMTLLSLGLYPPSIQSRAVRSYYEGNAIHRKMLAFDQMR